MSRDANGLWACPRCGTIIATEETTYPPGHTEAETRTRGCAACNKTKISPDDWIRVTTL